MNKPYSLQNLPKPANNAIGPRLVDVCPAYREKIRQFSELAKSDPAKAADIFAEAQAIAKAFWSGVDFACGADP